MITLFKIFENTGKKINSLYHGSSKSFDKFEKKFLGEDDHLLSYLGYHFTPDLNMAMGFARKPDFAIFEVEITVNKTLKIKESDLVKNILRWGCDNQYFYVQNIEEFLSQPYFSTTERSIMDELVDYHFVSDQISHEELALAYKKHLIKQGYDSIEYLNEIEFNLVPKRYDWIVFNNNQIRIINKFNWMTRFKNQR